MPREDHTLQFRAFEGGSGWEVELRIDSAVVGTTPLDLEWCSSGGDSAKALKRLRDGGGSDQDLRLVGSLLWSSLLGEGAVRDHARELWQRLGTQADLNLVVRLRLPPEVDDLPWEAAYDEDTARFVGGHRRSSLVREPWRDVALPQVLTRAEPAVRMLVVVPPGSGLDVGSELRRMREELEPVLPAIAGARHGAGFRELYESATVAEVRRVLTSERWDIVHFIGHARANARDGTSMRFVNDSGDDAWATQSVVSGLFDDAGVQLVVLNACSTGQSSSRDGFSGLGPVLLANGIPAVVTMRYSIEDRAAIRFSAAFYDELFKGPSPGRIEPALQRGRSALLDGFGSRDPRVFVTPALHLAPGQAPLFAIGPMAPVAAVAMRNFPGPAAPLALPRGLAEAVAKGLCVPVVGPHLEAPQERGGEAQRALVSALAEACSYPHDGEISLAKRAADGADLWVLQRVCQHFDVKHGRNKLTDAVVAECRSDVTQALRALARWRLPAIVSTTFDAAMQRAFQAEQPSHRAVYRLDNPVSPGDLAHPLVVHLRGSVRDETSLVLTESDHEDLLDRIGALEGEVASLLTADRRRTLLFLGVSPRDAWARAFAKRLLAEPIRRFCSVVFVGAASDVDRALWESLHVKVQWLDADPAEVVAQLSRAAVEARP